MKKIALFGLMALCLGFTACDDYKEPNPPAQSNPQEAIIETSDLTFTDAAAQLIDIAQLNNEGKAVELSKLDLANPLPLGFNLKLVAQVAPSTDFAHVAEIPATITDGIVTVTPDDLEGAYLDVISKDPKAREIAVRYAAYIVNDKSEVRVGNPETYFGQMTCNVLPLPATYVIEDAYYLIGTIANGDIKKAVKFNHTDASPYDDPNFSLVVNITNDEASEGWQWMVISESAFAAGNLNGLNTAFGVENEGDDYMDGMFIANAEGYTVYPDETGEEGTVYYGTVYEGGRYMFSINMEELTYEITLAIENLYTPGNSNGWSQTASQLLSTSNYQDYYGFAYLNGEFKFTTEPNWNGTNLGAGDEDGVLSTDGSAGNLNSGEAGLFWCHVNLLEKTYTITKVETLGCIGDFNGWAEQAPLTPSDDMLTWTGTVKLNGNGWKFRCNDDWGINLGGTLDNLVFDGANIMGTSDGSHKVTLYLGQLPYTATVE